MINIINITNNGRIEFSVNEELENAIFKIKDKNYQSEVYINNYEKLINGTNYFIELSSVLVPYLRKPYIELIFNNSIYSKNIHFPEGELGNFSLIGNSCLAWRTYERFNTPYNSPTIGNLILDDEEYLRFCEHVDSYFSAKMTFGESRGNLNFKNSCGNTRVINPDAHIPLDYPISHHLDVEIHWIHTKTRELIFNDSNFNFKERVERIQNNEFLEKWERRVKRNKDSEKIFLWSASELFNIHGNWKRKQLIDRFKSLPNRSIFLTERPEEEFEDEFHIVKYIPEWENYNQFQRDSSGGTSWNNQGNNSMIMYNIIKEKFIK